MVQIPENASKVDVLIVRTSVAAPSTLTVVCCRLERVQLVSCAPPGSHAQA